MCSEHGVASLSGPLTVESALAITINGGCPDFHCRGDRRLVEVGLDEAQAFFRRATLSGDHVERGQIFDPAVLLPWTESAEIAIRAIDPPYLWQGSLAVDQHIAPLEVLMKEVLGMQLAGLRGQGIDHVVACLRV